MARRAPMRMGAALGAVAMAASGLAACGDGSGPDTSASPSARFTTQKLAWDGCRGLPADQPGARTPKPGFECATMKVPLDYAEPGGRTLGLALIRVKATEQGGRLGSLVFNFGGPGGSGVEGLAGSADKFETLGARYDLVSFDPRGVGRSDPVKCLDDKQMDASAAEDGSPDDPAEAAAADRLQKETVQACEKNSGAVLPYVSTLNAARDMDVLRAVLGDAKLNYFGISYGTWLGGSYAHQFPARVGRAVLDGAVDTKISTEDLGLQQAAAFQRALRNFAADCVKQGPQRCPLGKDKDTIVAGVGALLQSLDTKPLPTQGGRKLTQSLGTNGVVMPLYSKEYWPLLAQGLTQAKAGDGSLLLRLADVQMGRDENGHYSNQIPANTAVNCADTTTRYTDEDVRKALPKFRNASPVFGSFMAWGMLQCTGWPVKGNDAAKNVSAPDATPIVVVGNIGDPATPYAWAPALAKELGKGVLVTLKGEGHGAYLTGDKCLQGKVDGYLLDGKVPAKGTTCG